MTAGSAMTAGIALPENVLTQPWFAVFSIFVAFNTIIYLGLTVSKFIPWPHQVQPRTVRQFIPIGSEEFTRMHPHEGSPTHGSADPEDSLRDSTARETIPLALGLTGAVTVLSGFVNTLLYFDVHGPLVLVGVGLGFVFIVMSQILMRASISSSSMRWIWVFLLIVLVSETSWRAEVLDSAVILGYAVIALMIIAPITLSWGAGLTGAIGGAVPIIISGYSVSLVNTVSWTIAASTAAAASLILLQLRLEGIRQIVIERQRADTLASTDTLTGVFSRTGLLALAPTIAAAAERSGSPVGVITCEVNEMTSINSDYGITYGDDVLSATARALKASLPQDAIVGRWNGDEFLAIMLGSPPHRDELTTAMDSALAATGVALGKRPVGVRIGCAEGDPKKSTLEEILAESTT